MYVRLENLTSEDASNWTIDRSDTLKMNLITKVMEVNMRYGKLRKSTNKVTKNNPFSQRRMNTVLARGPVAQRTTKSKQSLFGCFLKSQKFRLNSRLGQPLPLQDESSSFFKSRSSICQKGSPIVPCRTPQLSNPATRKSIKSPTKVITPSTTTVKTRRNPSLIREPILLRKPQESLQIQRPLRNSHRRKIATASMGHYKDIQPEPSTAYSSQIKPKNCALLQLAPKDLSNVKAESYALMQFPSGQLILANNAKQSLEIASLTKIMTCYTVIRMAQEYNMQMEQQKFTIAQHIQKSSGTSAELIQGDQYTIMQLLYALMLPSGNDAALALADWAGSLKTQSKNHKENIKTFVSEMNDRAMRLGLQHTTYGNPHGLPHLHTKSTAVDMCQLCCFCLSIPLFQTIVSTKHYKTTIKTEDGKDRQVQWDNTNKLLRRQGFMGIKTGITITAGPCLASAYTFKEKIYISVVLRSNKVSRRFSDTRKILSWSLDKLFSNDMAFEQRLVLQNLRKKQREFDSDYSDEEEIFQFSNDDRDEFKKRKNILLYEL